jgi:hypothetical protein
MLDAAGEWALAGGFALLAGGSRVLVRVLLNARENRHKNALGESGQETEKVVAGVELCFLTFAAIMFLIALVLLLLSMFA